MLCSGITTNLVVIPLLQRVWKPLHRSPIYWTVTVEWNESWTLNVKSHRVGAACVEYHIYIALRCTWYCVEMYVTYPNSGIEYHICVEYHIYCVEYHIYIPAWRVQQLRGVGECVLRSCVEKLQILVLRVGFHKSEDCAWRDNVLIYIALELCKP